MVKRILILLVVAVITVGILLFINNPGLLDKVWLWIVGLIGSIVLVVQQGWKWLQQQYESARKKLQPKSKENVFTGIIHFGGLGTDLKGDIILTDITQNLDTANLVEQSKAIYENFYQLVNNRLKKGEVVIFEISDEDRFKKKIN
jgi:hypothetical protein